MTDLKKKNRQVECEGEDEEYVADVHHPLVGQRQLLAAP
jgi:hypothetical protein